MVTPQPTDVHEYEVHVQLFRDLGQQVDEEALELQKGGPKDHFAIHLVLEAPFSLGRERFFLRI